jgi:predicted dehydrogenase
MGPATEVTAVCTTQAHRMEAEDTALAIVRFSSGAVGTILSSTAAFPGFPQRLEITGTKGTVTVEDGQIVRRAFGAGAEPVPAAVAGAEPVTAAVAGAEPVTAAVAVAGAPAGAVGPAAVGSDPAALDVASHAAQIADLLAAVDSGRQPAVSGQSAREALEIVCAVYESARTGRPVKLNR